MPVKTAQEAPQDTTILRFHFISDQIDDVYKEGWMIDDIRIYTVDLGSSIVENSSENFRIYPNPTNTSFLVIYGKLQAKTCRILDLTGKLVMISELKNESGGVSEIDISQLRSGIYFLEIDQQKQKLIVE